MNEVIHLTKKLANQYNQLCDIIVDHYEDIESFDCMKYDTYSRDSAHSTKLEIKSLKEEASIKFAMFDFTKKSNRMVTSASDNKIRIYATKTNELIKDFKFNGESLEWICYTKLDKWILTASKK